MLIGRGRFIARGLVDQPSGNIADSRTSWTGATGSERRPTIMAAIAATTAPAAMSHAIHSRDRRGGSGAIACAPPLDAVSIASIANARSSADWKRAFGSFSVHRRMMRVSVSGTCRALNGASGTSSFRIAVIVSGGVSRENARAPVTIS